MTDRTPVVLRRDQATWSAKRLRGGLAAAVVGVLVVVGSRGGFVGVLGGLVVSAVVLLFVRAALKNVRLEVDAEALVHRGLLGTRRWEWRKVGSVLVATRVTASDSKPEVTWVVPRGRHGRRLVQVTSTSWSTASLATLVEQVGRHAEVHREDGPLTLTEVASRHRGAFSLAQRQPVLWSVGLTVVVIVVALVVSFVGYDLFGPE